MKFFMGIRITITRFHKPATKNINEELQWLGNSLGLFNLRDKDKSCFRIFIELLKTTKQGTPLTSDQLAEKLQLTRGTVVHHIHKLNESGIVVQEKSGYRLRVENLSRLIDEIENDLTDACKELREIADEIDRKLK